MEDFVKIIPILVLLFVYLAPHLFRKRGGGREEENEDGEAGPSAPPRQAGREPSADPAEEALRRIEAMLRGDKPEEPASAPPPRSAEGGGESEAARHDRPVAEGAPAAPPPLPPRTRTVIRNREPVVVQRRGVAAVAASETVEPSADTTQVALVAAQAATSGPRPSRAGRGRPGRAELRRHVWWSEVLGPCRGLRD